MPMSHSFKEPIQPADFGSGRCPISKSIQTVTTAEDGQQIIEEECLTRLDNTILTLSDMCPAKSLSMGKDGTIVLKESGSKIDFHSQGPTGEGAESSSGWRHRMDHSQTRSAPQSVESSSEEPQENDEERRPQDQDDDE
ncbi:MAG: hypothetical protein GY861_27865 [bacterium]|nr:hypothetical protein [bacterium]